MLQFIVKEGVFLPSNAQKKAIKKYLGSLDEIRIRMKQDGTKEKIFSHAAAQGESVNGFINRAIAETMERDQQKEK